MVRHERLAKVRASGFANMGLMNGAGGSSGGVPASGNPETPTGFPVMDGGPVEFDLTASRLIKARVSESPSGLFRPVMGGIAGSFFSPWEFPP